jgi:hypothetical protein
VKLEPFEPALHVAHRARCALHSFYLGNEGQRATQLRIGALSEYELFYSDSSFVGASVFLHEMNGDV